MCLPDSHLDPFQLAGHLHVYEFGMFEHIPPL